MPTIDLRNYIVAPSGPWTKDAEALTATEFVLSQRDDQVTFTGPVAISVTLQAENRTLGPSGDEEKLFFHDVYTYALTVPPGNTWTYRFVENESALRLLGSNRGSRVVIRPGLIRTPATPVLIGTDLPCDFAVNAIPNSGQFFPAGCEPCPPGVPIGLPPGATPTLVEPAPGGCVRPRFFNGMSMTREDMDTEQRFFRMKNKLQNRAMGQGVVWGLNLTRYSASICIEPGYAVDCCGNDLVVTEPYRVNIDALLRDPASFQFLIDTVGFRRSSVDDCDQPVPPGIIVDPAPQLCRRMHLLLEYVDCPQDARPVHGDPCSPEVTRCEMSRIRETVRLRLVPPRDYNPKGPIDKFLDDYKAVLSEVGLTGASTAAGSTITTSTDLAVPFQIDVNAQHSIFLRPPGFSGTVIPDRTVTQTLTLPTVFEGQPSNTIPSYAVHFQVRGTSGFAVNSGQVTDDKNNVVANVNAGSAVAFDWIVQVPVLPTNGFPPGTNSVNENRVFTIAQWQAAPATGQPVLAGSTQVTLAVNYSVPSFDNGGVTLTWSVAVAPTEVSIIVPELGPYPCNSEACGCDPTLPRFPVFPPFLHNDPRPGKGPVDWKILVAALTYGLLVSEEARHHTGTPQAVVTPRLQLVAALYVVVLRALFGANTLAQIEALTRAIRCLFQAWCKALLYPGPECEKGIHGVVIGCAQIQGGRIVDVDPWGGRRWVVHYPLLSYWGHQFGIVPLDVTASRLFSMICCLGGLPAPIFDLRGGNNTGVVGTAPPITGLSTGHLALGQVMLVAGSRDQAVAQLRSAGVTPVATRELSLPEFASALLLRLREQPVTTGAEYTLFSLKDSPDMHFAAPVLAEAAGAASAAVAPAPQPVDRLPGLVAAAVDAKTKSTVPPLLRGLSETVAVNLLRIAPIPRATEDDKSALGKKLATAGLSTYGAILARDPQDVLRATGPEMAPDVSDVLTEAEAVLTAVVKTSYKSMAQTAKATESVSPADLKNEDKLAQLGRALTEAMHRDKRLNLPEPVVTSVASDAVKNAAS